MKVYRPSTYDIGSIPTTSQFKNYYKQNPDKFPKNKSIQIKEYDGIAIHTHTLNQIEVLPQKFRKISDIQIKSGFDPKDY